MLWLILGDYGAGKTLYMVLVAVSSKFQNIGNFSLYIDNYKQIRPNELKHLAFGTNVFLDEIYLWLEARTSTAKMNRYTTAIVSQSRHRKINIYGTAHNFSSVDIRYRTNVHRLVLATRIGKREEDITEEEDFRDFKYSIMNTYDFSKKHFRLTYEDACKYFDIYDSFEILEYPNQDEIELDVLKYSPRELYDFIKKIGDELKPEFEEKITKSMVRLELLKRGYSSYYTSDVYGYLKQI